MTELLTRCPSCGYRADSTFETKLPGEEPSKPHAGALSLCIACGRFAIYEDDMVGLRLRLPTEEEQAVIDADDFPRRVLEAWERIRAEHPHAWPGRA